MTKRKPTEADYRAAAMIMDVAVQAYCTYCRKQMAWRGKERRITRDHIWPKAMRNIEAGRTGTVWCCAECNQAKADKSPAEWLAEVHERIMS